MGIRFKRRGFSLFEIVIVMFLSSILMASITLIFLGGLKSWDIGYKRHKMKRNLALTLERMSKDLRQARRVDRYSNKNDSIEFDILEKQPDGSYVVNTYVYYLYSPDDNWPNPPWKAPYYQLRKLGLAGGFVYGRGALLLQDIETPKSSDIIESSIMRIQLGKVKLDFLIRSGDETIQMRTEVKPRNVQ